MDAEGLLAGHRITSVVGGPTSTELSLRKSTSSSVASQRVNDVSVNGLLSACTDRDMRTKHSDSFGTLELYWVDIDPKEEVGRYWGQVAGSTHRLLFIVDALETLLLQEKYLTTATRLLKYHIENYLYRVYELRERLTHLLSAITGRNLGALKSSSRPKRARALRKLEETAPHLLPSSRRIFRLLDEDILLRNRHTHKNFLALGFYTGADVYDPCDVLEIDLAGSPKEKAVFEEHLRRAIRRVVTEYSHRVNSINKETWGLLEASRADISRTSDNNAPTS